MIEINLRLHCKFHWSNNTCKVSVTVVCAQSDPMMPWVQVSVWPSRCLVAFAWHFVPGKPHSSRLFPPPFVLCCHSVRQGTAGRRRILACADMTAHLKVRTSLLSVHTQTHAEKKSSQSKKINVIYCFYEPEQFLIQASSPVQLLQDEESEADIWRHHLDHHWS